MAFPIFQKNKKGTIVDNCPHQSMEKRFFPVERLHGGIHETPKRLIGIG